MRRITPYGSFSIAAVCAIAAFWVRHLDRVFALGTLSVSAGGDEYAAKNSGVVLMFAAAAVLFAALGARDLYRRRR